MVLLFEDAPKACTTVTAVFGEQNDMCGDQVKHESKAQEALAVLDQSWGKAKTTRDPKKVSIQICWVSFFSYHVGFNFQSSEAFHRVVFRHLIVLSGSVHVHIAGPVVSEGRSGLHTHYPFERLFGKFARHLVWKEGGDAAAEVGLYARPASEQERKPNIRPINAAF
jgi:hypothetical protein